VHVFPSRRIVFELAEFASPGAKVIVVEHHKEERLFLASCISFCPESINGKFRDAVPLAELRDPFERKSRGQRGIY
jgi:hypothetical protein